MTAGFVVDVNVAITANGKHHGAKPKDRRACIQSLITVRDGIVCLDSKDRILKEYRTHLCMSGQPGTGDEFMYWVYQNQYEPARCQRVAITPLPHDDQDFEEFPRDPDLRAFDRADRKYVAVAQASSLSPKILNATDSGYWRHKDALEKNGIRIEFVCPDLMK